MKKIAVTGFDGFIGSFVVEKLKREQVKIKKYDYKKNNLLDSESLKSFVQGQDTIIHLAGVNRGTNHELFQVNVSGTLSLLDAVCKYAPNTHIIFASTFQVYLSNSLYGASKQFAEMLFRHYNDNYKIQSTILRLSNVYGPGGKPFYNSVIATFAHLVKSGQNIIINGDGNQKRDFIFIEDAADAFIKAAFRSQKKLEIIDICSGKEVSLNEVIGILKNVSSKNFQVMYNKGVKEKPWPTKDKNFNKAYKLLNWKPLTPLTKGLEQVIKYG